jgi:hypothetical protein
MQLGKFIFANLDREVGSPTEAMTWSRIDGLRRTCDDDGYVDSILDQCETNGIRPCEWRVVKGSVRGKQIAIDISYLDLNAKLFPLGTS